MVKTEGTYIQVVYKNVFGYISTNSWPFFMIQRPKIREKCAWVRSNTWPDERPVFFGFSIFRQTSQLATEKIQNLCNRNRWSGLLQLGSVRFRSFFQSSELDLRTLRGIISGLWIRKQHDVPMGCFRVDDIFGSSYIIGCVIKPGKFVNVHAVIFDDDGVQSQRLSMFIEAKSWGLWATCFALKILQLFQPFLDSR